MHAAVQWLKSQIAYPVRRLVVVAILGVLILGGAIVLKTLWGSRMTIRAEEIKSAQESQPPSDPVPPQNFVPGEKARPLNAHSPTRHSSVQALPAPTSLQNPLRGQSVSRNGDRPGGPAEPSSLNTQPRPTSVVGPTPQSTRTAQPSVGEVPVAYESSGGSMARVAAVPSQVASSQPSEALGASGGWIVPDDSAISEESQEKTPPQLGQSPGETMQKKAEVLEEFSSGLTEHRVAEASRQELASDPQPLNPIEPKAGPLSPSSGLAPETADPHSTGTSPEPAPPPTGGKGAPLFSPANAGLGEANGAALDGSSRPNGPLATPFDRLPPPVTGRPPAVITPPPTRSPLPLEGASSSGGFSAGQDFGGSTGDSPGFTLSGESDARPGDASLEGPQTPQITIQKILPSEVQVGKPASARIVIRNSGAIVINKVDVQDPIPWGVRILRTKPQATRQSQGMLGWTLGPLKPGDELALEIEFMPLQEGELGSVVTVSVHAEASARTRSTRPQLNVKADFPSEVLIGAEVVANITVSNTGSGVATNVVLEEHVPPEMQHPAGSELENVLGDLPPGESRQVQLRLRAVRPGSAVNRLIGRADANIHVEEQSVINVLAPQLKVGIEGPAKRFLERETSYQISLSNAGTARSRMVRLTVALPPGLQFVRANNSGAYDPTTHSVQWLLEELPVGQTGQVELVVRPIAAGEQMLMCTVRDELGLGDDQRLAIQVEGISALHFQVTDTRDPVAVGSDTTYEIRVVNQGTKEASNVQVMVILPEGLRPLAGEGPTPNTVNGSEVLFGKLSRLPARSEAVFKVRAQAVSPGDQRVRVQILSDDIRLPITKEESTQVYADIP